MITARMYVAESTRVGYPNGGTAPAEKIKLAAVYSSDPADPNFSYSQATPSASFELYINNPDAIGQLEPGKTYDIAITEHVPESAQ